MAIGDPTTKEESKGLTIPISGTGFLAISILLSVILGIGYVEYVRRTTVAPEPSPVVPGRKTLAKLVSPEAATELANLYHAQAVVLQADKDKLQNDSKQGPSLKTVGDFYEMNQEVSRIFQKTKNITGVAAINEPISQRLRTATGSLDPSRGLDDPATNVRESLVAVCKQISEEFDPAYVNISLNEFK